MPKKSRRTEQNPGGRPRKSLEPLKEARAQLLAQYADDLKRYVEVLTTLEGKTPEEAHQLILGNPMFSKGGLVRWDKMCSKLAQRTGDVSKSLVASLDVQSWKLLNSLNGNSPDHLPLQEAVVAVLNKLIAGPLIYAAGPFAKVDLRRETKLLKQRNPQKDDLKRLNRLLLEDAYPEDISRNLLLPSGNYVSSKGKRGGASLRAALAIFFSPELIGLAVGNNQRGRTVRLLSPLWEVSNGLITTAAVMLQENPQAFRNVLLEAETLSRPPKKPVGYARSAPVVQMEGQNPERATAPPMDLVMLFDSKAARTASLQTPWIRQVGSNLSAKGFCVWITEEAQNQEVQALKALCSATWPSCASPAVKQPETSVFLSAGQAILVGRRVKPSKYGGREYRRALLVQKVAAGSAAEQVNEVFFKPCTPDPTEWDFTAALSEFMQRLTKGCDAVVHVHRSERYLTRVVKTAARLAKRELVFMDK